MIISIFGKLFFVKYNDKRNLYYLVLKWASPFVEFNKNADAI